MCQQRFDPFDPTSRSEKARARGTNNGTLSPKQDKCEEGHRLNILWIKINSVGNVRLIGDWPYSTVGFWLSASEVLSESLDSSRGGWAASPKPQEAWQESLIFDVSIRVHGREGMVFAGMGCATVDFFMRRSRSLRISGAPHCECAYPVPPSPHVT